MIRIYTDGAAQGNPGPGGYGVIMKYKDAVKELSEGFRLTTNNRMELLAVIKGLEAIKKEGIPVAIYSDSKYVVDAIEKGWIWGSATYPCTTNSSQNTIGFVGMQAIRKMNAAIIWL
jgi:ribonuclease HI